MAKKKILIVGGGFGGLKAALELSHDHRFEVTLVSDRSYFQYYPTLYHTATGGLSAQSQIPIETIFAGKPVDVILDTAQTLDRRAKTLTLAGGQVLSYDSIILGLGVVTNYFGIDGLKEFSYSIKSIDEINRFKEHVHRQLLDERKPDLHYVIVGGGPTGIELAGALPSYLHRLMKQYGIRDRRVNVDLIEGADRLMPRMPKSTSRAIARRLRTLGVTLHLGEAVQGETAEALHVSGKSIISKTVVWTAGIANSPFFAENGFSFGPRGKVAVNVYLQADDDVYVIGDNANTPSSGMAQTAVLDGTFVAKNLIRAVNGKDMKAYKPKKPIYATPVGPGWAAVQWGKVEIFGWLGQALREAADAKAFSELEPLMKAAKQWFTGLEEDDYDVRLDTKLQKKK